MNVRIEDIARQMVAPPICGAILTVMVPISGGPATRPESIYCDLPPGHPGDHGATVRWQR